MNVDPDPAPRHQAVNIVPVPGAPGRLGLTSCPGWHDEPGPSAATRLALARDLAKLAAAGTSMLVTLIAAAELDRIGDDAMRAACDELRIAWAHCPIHDMEVPGASFERAWALTGPQVHRRLDAGELVTLHCRAGLGRSGTVAARVLVERGLVPGDAIDLVRRYRPGAIETATQEAYVHGCAPHVRPGCEAAG
jgi:protein-tyrosine phosphatase